MESDQNTPPPFHNKQPEDSSSVASGIVPGVKNAVNMSLDTINYRDIARAHADFIKLAGSIETVQWLGEHLGIDDWKNKKFLGKKNVLPSPGLVGLDRLKKLAETLSVEWGGGNGLCPLHPQYIFLDGFMQKCFFSERSMRRTNHVLQQIHRDWQSIKYDDRAKRKYCEEELGLVVEDWSQLTGKLWKNGDHEAADSIYIVSGFIDEQGDNYHLYLDSQHAVGSNINLWRPDIGGLCLLTSFES